MVELDEFQNDLEGDVLDAIFEQKMPLKDIQQLVGISTNFQRQGLSEARLDKAQRAIDGPPGKPVLDAKP